MYGGDGWSPLFTPARRSLTEVPRLQSPSRKVMASPTRAFFESRGVMSSDLLLNKLEEVKQSVEKIESLVGDNRHS